MTRPPGSQTQDTLYLLKILESCSKRRIGPCMEDEDKRAIAGIDGLRFDVAWRPNHPAIELDLRLPELRFAPITWLYVFQSQTFVQYLPRILHQAT